ncbi:MAG: hypothetical protein K6C34_04095 [Alphaproteobacteria bacterium]|nr:hypothetical protein [Alphaproteobacteria bacterium]
MKKVIYTTMILGLVFDVYATESSQISGEGGRQRGNSMVVSSSIDANTRSGRRRALSGTITEKSRKALAKAGQKEESELDKIFSTRRTKQSPTAEQIDEGLTKNRAAQTGVNQRTALDQSVQGKRSIFEDSDTPKAGSNFSLDKRGVTSHNVVQPTTGVYTSTGLSGTMSPTATTTKTAFSGPDQRSESFIARDQVKLRHVAQSKIKGDQVDKAKVLKDIKDEQTVKQKNLNRQVTYGQLTPEERKAGPNERPNDKGLADLGPEIAARAQRRSDKHRGLIPYVSPEDFRKRLIDLAKAVDESKKSLQNAITPEIAEKIAEQDPAIITKRVMTAIEKISPPISEAASDNFKDLIGMHIAAVVLPAQTQSRAQGQSTNAVIPYQSPEDFKARILAKEEEMMKNKLPQQELQEDVVADDVAAMADVVEQEVKQSLTVPDDGQNPTATGSWNTRVAHFATAIAEYAWGWVRYLFGF